MKIQRNWVIIGIVIVLAIILSVYFYEKEDGIPDVITRSDVDISAPAQEDYIYKHDIGFTVLIPRGWRVAERYDSQNLEVVVYPSTYGDKIPEAFSTRTHVSLFPYGTGSGGDFPWAATTSAPINQNDGAFTQQFLTQSKSVWGWSISFKGIPSESQWRSWGTVYASIDMIEGEAACAAKDGKTKDERLCNQLEGDILFRNGRINRIDEATILRILKSIDIE